MASSTGRIDGPRALVDYAASLDCIHCGLCLQTCPTFRLTGVETSSPRGRIHLMRAIAEDRAAADADYAEELDFCLLCRHCESVCPAGVRFGEMMEFARGTREQALPRGRLARLARWLGFRVVLPSRAWLRVASSLLWLAQLLRLDRLAARLGGSRAAGLADLPRVPPLSDRALLPRTIPARGEERGRALLLEGCMQPELFGRVNRATADSLARLGIASRVPSFTCCGSLQAHNGDPEGARRLARAMLAACERLDGDDPIVVNSAGCGAHMRELANLFAGEPDLAARARSFAARVVDYSVFVAPLVEDRDLRVPRELSPVTWDDPCHLCHAQNVRDEPRRVLARLTGVEVVPLANSEACCGSAGIYSLLRPEDSRAVFEPKLAAFCASGARTLVTSNPGCQLQWTAGFARAGVDARVVHLAELVATGLAPAETPSA